MLERQGLHAALLAALVALVLAAARLDAVREGALAGLGSRDWLLLAVAAAVGHQVYVWLCWRGELHASLLTRLLGAAAFPLFAAGFAGFAALRGITIVGLAVANRDTLPLAETVSKGLALVAAAASAALFVSVARHFGFLRGMGADHFDPSYRGRPLVREGLFRLTPNAMYVFGFFAIWVPGLWLSSAAALVAAAFSHAYIWVHYACTERPDMREIYGERPPASPSDARRGATSVMPGRPR